MWRRKVSLVIRKSLLAAVFLKWVKNCNFVRLFGEVMVSLSIKREYISFNRLLTLIYCRLEICQAQRFDHSAYIETPERRRRAIKFVQHTKANNDEPIGFGDRHEKWQQASSSWFEYYARCCIFSTGRWVPKSNLHINRAKASIPRYQQPSSHQFQL